MNIIKKISKEIHDELFFIKRLKKFFSFFDEISNIKENPGKKYTLENNVKRKIQRII